MSVPRKHDDVTGCLAPFLAAGVALALAPWWAFVTSVLWGWFVVPKFGLPPLGWAEAYGLHLVAVMVVGYRGRSQEDPVDAAITTVLAAIIYPALALLLGWVAVSLI